MYAHDLVEELWKLPNTQDSLDGQKAASATR